MNTGTYCGPTSAQGPLYQELTYQLSSWKTQYMPS
jgi:hypothetical protein